MEIFLAGTDVELVVDLLDKAGNALDVTSIKYRVSDENGVELIALTDLTSFVPAADTAIVPVPASQNSLAVDAYRGIRNIELHCVVATNTVLLNKFYAIEASEILIVGVNSFQTLAQAEMTSLEIPGLYGWATATDQEKETALIDARQKISLLSFKSTFDLSIPQDNAAFIPEGEYVGIPGIGILFSGDITILTPTQYATLPEKFKKALRQAQVAEANDTLSGGTTSSRRADGVILETIGEVKKMFRSGKAAKMAVGSKALVYLSRYISLNVQIGRS